MKLQTAFLDVALGGNCITAGSAGGKIEKEKSLLLSKTVAGFSIHKQNILNLVEGLFGNHGHMTSLMEFPLVLENTVIEMRLENMIN
ncbi:MAG: hypothetical protein M3R59_09850 [Verrucomicrobiota bacterium]|nr:hypothetical protein [Verrucomicrobiota bacterium]